MARYNILRRCGGWRRSGWALQDETPGVEQLQGEEERRQPQDLPGRSSPHTCQGGGFGHLACAACPGKLCFWSCVCQQSRLRWPLECDVTDPPLPTVTVKIGLIWFDFLPPFKTILPCMSIHFNVQTNWIVEYITPHELYSVSYKKRGAIYLNVHYKSRDVWKLTWTHFFNFQPTLLIMVEKQYW